MKTRALLTPRARRPRRGPTLAERLARHALGDGALPTPVSLLSRLSSSRGSRSLALLYLPTGDRTDSRPARGACAAPGRRPPPAARGVGGARARAAHALLSFTTRDTHDVTAPRSRAQRRSLGLYVPGPARANDVGSARMSMSVQRSARIFSVRARSPPRRARCAVGGQREHQA